MDQSDLLTRSGNTEDEEREVILELTRRTKSLRKGKPKEEVDKKSLKDEKTVLFVDTTGEFRPERLLEILKDTNGYIFYFSELHLLSQKISLKII